VERQRNNSQMLILVITAHHSYAGNDDRREDISVHRSKIFNSELTVILSNQQVWLLVVQLWCSIVCALKAPKCPCSVVRDGQLQLCNNMQRHRHASSLQPHAWMYPGGRPVKQVKANKSFDTTKLS